MWVEGRRGAAGRWGAAGGGWDTGTGVALGEAVIGCVGRTPTRCGERTTSSRSQGIGCGIPGSQCWFRG
eukprot:3916699-Prorocentrum_lima.AAC.1